MYASLEDIKAIAEAVAREELCPLEIVGVTSGEGRHGYVEIVVVRDTQGSDSGVFTIGVNRHLDEPSLREQISSAIAHSIGSGLGR
jgi:hypothetical protein